MEYTNMNEYINNLDWSKEHAINLYYIPKGAFNMPEIKRAKLISGNWYYRTAHDVETAMIGATAGARLKYKTGFIMSVDAEKNAIVKIIKM